MNADERRSPEVPCVVHLRDEYNPLRSVTAARYGRSEGTGRYGESRLLNPKVMTLAKRILPHRVLTWLDPFQAVIEREVLLAASRTASGQVVLDAGAGEARHRQYFKEGTYLALDFAQGEPAWDYSNLDLLGDLGSIPLQDASVDRVLCMVVLEHTRNPEKVLREFARVMKRGAGLHLIVPFLWEEHQAPHDYHRFTRYGVQLLFESLPFEIELSRPVGGFFWVLGRRCVNLLTFFQHRWRWPFFFILAPFFGVLFPVALYFLDRLDSDKSHTLGFLIRARRT